MELSLEGLQYKNQLLLDLANRKHQIKMDGYTRWKGVLDQINTEKSINLQQDQLQLEKDKFKYQKEKDAAKAYIDSGSGGSGGSSGSTTKKTQTTIAASGNAVKEAKRASFSGEKYDEAVEYLKKNGVQNSLASNIMTYQEWARRKASYNQTGVGGAAAAVDTYSDYLKYQTEFIIENKDELIKGGK